MLLLNLEHFAYSINLVHRGHAYITLWCLWYANHTLLTKCVVLTGYRLRVK